MVLETVERLEDELAEERRRNAALADGAAERDGSAAARRTSRSTGDADRGK
jgi:hypothetical protein